jgi:small subunit ribosomal protein S3Ae
MAKPKTKKWIEITGPKIFNEVPIGQTAYLDAKNLKGRKVKVNLSNLIGDFSKQHINLGFKIKDVVDEKAITEVESFKIQKQYIVRRVRRGSSKIESINDIKLKDGAKVRIKSVCITAFASQTQQKKGLQAKLSENVEKLCAEYNFEALVLALCSDKIKNSVHSKLNKTYPVRFFEVYSVQPLAKQ